MPRWWGCDEALNVDRELWNARLPVGLRVPFPKDVDDVGAIQVGCREVAMCCG